MQLQAVWAVRAGLRADSIELQADLGVFQVVQPGPVTSSIEPPVDLAGAAAHDGRDSGQDGPAAGTDDSVDIQSGPPCRLGTGPSSRYRGARHATAQGCRLLELHAARRRDDSSGDAGGTELTVSGDDDGTEMTVSGDTGSGQRTVTGNRDGTITTVHFDISTMEMILLGSVAPGRMQLGVLSGLLEGQRSSKIKFRRGHHASRHQLLLFGKCVTTDTWLWC